MSSGHQRPGKQRTLTWLLWGTEPLPKTLGLYQCFGGAIGTVTLLDVAPRLMASVPPDARASGLVLYLSAAALMVLLLVAGALLLTGKRIGLLLTIIAQFAQVFYFSLGPATYAFFGGLYVGLTLRDSALVVTFGWQVYVELGQAAEHSVFGLNLVPLAILAYIAVSRSDSDRRAEISSVSFRKRRQNSDA